MMYFIRNYNTVYSSFPLQGTDHQLALGKLTSDPS